MHTLWFLFLLAIKLTIISSKSCDFVRNLKVNHRDTEKWNSTTVTGCISDATFSLKIVRDISIQCENEILPTLEKKFITNMNHLKQILIDSCHIDVIEPGAFSNLPVLESLTIEGNPLKHIPRGVFDVLPSLHKLYVYYNKISSIEDHAFANLPNLKYFSLEKNKLNHLRKEWFTNTSNIKEFLADGNAIQKIPSAMFHGWKKLEDLNLNSNAISEIDDGTFTDTAPVMEYLALHHNRLTSLSPKIFSDSVFINNLIISGNLLNYLSEDFLNKIRVYNLYIFGNPFTCPCLERIHKILLDRYVTIDDPTDTEYVQVCKKTDVPVCGVSLQFPRTCNDSVDREVTRQVLSRMKKVGYDIVRTGADYQCAMFDDFREN